MKEIIGHPKTVPVGLFFGSEVNDPPLPTPYGLWHLAPPVVQVSPLGPVPSTGVLVLPARTPPVPMIYYLQAFIGEGLSNLCVLDTHPPIY